MQRLLGTEVIYKDTLGKTQKGIITDVIDGAYKFTVKLEDQKEKKFLIPACFEKGSPLSIADRGKQSIIDELVNKANDIIEKKRQEIEQKRKEEEKQKQAKADEEKKEKELKADNSKKASKSSRSPTISTTASGQFDILEIDKRDRPEGLRFVGVSGELFHGEIRVDRQNGAAGRSNGLIVEVYHFLKGKGYDIAKLKQALVETKVKANFGADNRIISLDRTSSDYKDNARAILKMIQTKQTLTAGEVFLLVE